MSTLHYPEPPTVTSLNEARRELTSQRKSVHELSDKIQEAEENLARIIQESKCAIRQMEKDRAMLEEDMAQTLAYISPIKRLPQELLRLIFYMNFEDYPCCAWVLAAVCKLWRRLALSMPKIWSTIRLVTTQDSSADTIRLWLERSGQNTPLDIEIFLKSAPSPTSASLSRRRRASSGAVITVDGWPGTWSDATWPPPPPPAPAGGPAAIATYVDFATQAGGIIPLALPTQGPFDQVVVPIHSDRSIAASPQAKSRASIHWGYIAFYYLAEQMHRWERFVFRFDKKFSSIASLKNIGGDVPLLKEFEVSCAEPAFAGDWSWLPCAKPNSTFHIPKLRSLTLQYVPFKWSSPMLTNLRTLSLRTLPTTHIALDRILYMISQSSALENLSLFFTSVNPAVLPLVPTVLNELKTFSIGGHYLLNSLVDSLSLPALQTLAIDVDGRDPVEDTITNLVVRSNIPPLTTLSLAYGLTGNSSGGIYYAAGSVVASWQFLRELDHLRTLQVGGTSFEPLLSSLTIPDDENGQEKWLCPNLTTVAMRNCHTHGDGVSKLVQMVEARNPDTAAGHTAVAANGVVPTRVKHLEVHECVILGLDVLTWLKNRVDDVVCTEPAFDSSPRSPYPYNEL